MFFLGAFVTQFYFWQVHKVMIINRKLFPSPAEVSDYDGEVVTHHILLFEQ